MKRHRRRWNPKRSKKWTIWFRGSPGLSRDRFLEHRIPEFPTWSNCPIVSPSSKISRFRWCDNTDIHDVESAESEWVCLWFLRAVISWDPVSTGTVPMIIPNKIVDFLTSVSLKHLPSSHLLHSYWTWPSRNREFSHEKWWFSMAMLHSQRLRNRMILQSLKTHWLHPLALGWSHGGAGADMDIEHYSNGTINELHLSSER